MYTYDRLQHLDLEVSSLCNALCPVCNRRQSGGIKNPMFAETYVTLEQYKKWFPVELISRLFSISFCGNYGDAMTNPELISILEYTKELNPNIKVTMNTNASGRNEKFWQDLGRLVGSNGHVTFSIDGLEDTNHIYRRGTHWHKIMSAAKNYIGAGGTARWDYLVFKHNQHQVTEAEALAKEMGFDHFFHKKALGFVNSDTDRVATPTMHVFNETGQLDYVLEPPMEGRWQNNVIKDYISKTTFNKVDGEDVESKHALKTFKLEEHRPKYIPKPFKMDNTRPLTQWEKDLGSTKIDCLVLKSDSFFVSSEGLVWPCCFTASKYYAYDNEETSQLKSFINDYGKDKISLRHVTLKDIIDGPMFQEKYVENFNDNNVRNKRLRTCSIFCGKDTNAEMQSTWDSVKTKYHT